jgi:hypothetical protein
MIVIIIVVEDTLNRKELYLIVRKKITDITIKSLISLNQHI